MFRQDRANPSTAVSNWNGRRDTAKGWPSTAVSSWLNGGLFSAGVAYAGFVAGGYNSGNKDFIDKFLFADDSRVTLAATLQRAKAQGSGMGNAGVAGYAAWGGSNYIDKLDYATDTTAEFDSGINGGQNQAASNQGVAGYFAFANTIRKLDYSNDTVSTESGNILVGSRSGPGAALANSGTAYYLAGGNIIGTGYATTISKYTFAGTHSTVTATLSSARENLAGCADSGNFGYFGGGNLSGYSNQSTVDKLTFSGDSVSTLGTGLSATNNYNTAFGNSGSAGYFAGGYNGSSIIATVDKFAFSNDARSTLGTGLSTAVYGSCGFANQGTLA